MSSTTIHASAVLVGARAVLIRGPSGSGKSRLALELIQAARSGALRFARLVGDDRVHVEAAHGRLLVRPAAALAGLIELRGVGMLQLPYEPGAVVGLVVDLAARRSGCPTRSSNERRSKALRWRGLPSQQASRPCRPCWRSSLLRTVIRPRAGTLSVGNW
jgi:HPr serine kinase-like protein